MSKEQLTAELCNNLAERLKPLTRSSQISRELSANIGSIAAMAELPKNSPVRAQLISKIPMFVLLDVISELNPEMIQSMARDQLRSVALVLAGQRSIFDEDELLSILEGRREMRALNKNPNGKSLRDD